MNLSVLLQAHQAFLPAGLAQNLGDGYLVTKNFVYRRIREEALKVGFQLSSQSNPGYDVFPLLQLEDILSKKTLPYCDNVQVFKELSPHQLHKISMEDLAGNYKRNFVFHEGAHAVARSLSLQILGPLPSPLTSESEFFLRVLLEESCANTCELLGAMDAEDKIHRAFYELNSYICHFEKRSLLKKAFLEMGPRTLVPYLTVCYLQANFLREQIQDQDQDWIDLAVLSEKQNLTIEQLKTLRSLGKTAFQLSARFRYQTTALQFRLVGIQTPLEKLVQFNFLEKLRRDQNLIKFVQAFAQLFESVR